jgi:hypothetical protein
MPADERGMNAFGALESVSQLFFKVRQSLFFHVIRAVVSVDQPHLVGGDFTGISPRPDVADLAIIAALPFAGPSEASCSGLTPL